MNMQKTVKGRIHSVESCGTVDGPGIRFVIFTQGCPLRCLYCHNPDCRNEHEGKEISVNELIAEIQRVKPYIQSGGVTVSGGEPLIQPEFVAEIFRQAHQIGLHTALDTSGYVHHIEAVEPVLGSTDLVLLDIKSYDPEIYYQITHVDVEPTLNFARYLDSIHKPTWIRFVLVPGLSDPEANVTGLAKFVSTLSNVEQVEVLPFHKMGEYKWRELGLDYKLFDTPPPTPDLIEHVKKIFQAEGLKVS